MNRFSLQSARDAIWMSMGLVLALAVGRFGTDEQTVWIYSLVGIVSFFSLILALRLRHKVGLLPTQAEIDATTYTPSESLDLLKGVAGSCVGSLEGWCGLYGLVALLVPAFHALLGESNAPSSSFEDALFILAIVSVVGGAYALNKEKRFPETRIDAFIAGTKASSKLLDDLTK